MATAREVNYFKNAFLRVFAKEMQGYFESDALGLQKEAQAWIDPINEQVINLLGTHGITTMTHGNRANLNLYPIQRGLSRIYQVLIKESEKY